MSDEDFEKIIEKLEAEREELIECNEQFSVDNQNLKYQRDKAWQNTLHWRNKSFDLEEKLALMTTERDEAWERAAYVEKMWGEAEVKLGKAEAKALRKAAAEIKLWWDADHDSRQPDALILALIKGESREVPDR